MIQKFNALPQRLKIICIAVAILFALAIVLSIPSLTQKISTSITNSKSTYVDKHSGVTVKNSTENPESYGLPKGTPNVVGDEQLTNSGLSFKKTMLLSSVLMAYYQHQNIANNTNIRIVSIGKDIKSDWNGTTSTGIYNTTIQLDGKGDLIPLQIIDTYSSLKYYFAVRLKFDQDYQTIYETSNNIN